MKISQPNFAQMFWYAKYIDIARLPCPRVPVFAAGLPGACNWKNAKLCFENRKILHHNYNLASI